jgi:hypothetical protein
MRKVDMRQNKARQVGARKGKVDMRQSKAREVGARKGKKI